MADITHYKYSENMTATVPEENTTLKGPLCLQGNGAWLTVPLQCEQFSKSQNSICDQADVHREFLSHAKKLRDQDQNLNEYGASNKEISSNDSRMPLNILWLP